MKLGHNFTARIAIIGLNVNSRRNRKLEIRNEKVGSEISLPISRDRNDGAA